MSVSGVLQKEEGAKSVLSKTRWTPKWINITEDKFQYFATEKKPAASSKPRKQFLLSECLLATSTEGGIKDADLCFEVSAMHDARQTDLSSSVLACIPIPTTTCLTHVGTHIYPPSMLSFKFKMVPITQSSSDARTNLSTTRGARSSSTAARTGGRCAIALRACR
mmetsp:Transcript_91543/g.261622  ORF Transcript_91543/g.261622 Transcript_91543/m.261622 type:complete len:165 (-) Transcript_91543:335-829(-)